MLADFRLFQRERRARFLATIDRKALLIKSSPFVLATIVVLALAYVVLPSGDAPQPPPPEDAAAIAPGPTEIPFTPTPRTGRKLNVFGTPEPTPTPRPVQRPTEVIPTATPTATPVYDDVQYIANGGLEEGLTGWYAEPGASITTIAVHRGTNAIQIAASGGFASYQVHLNPGVTYRLFAWGALSGIGGSGSVGIEFFDAYGNRLQASEPTPLLFSGTAYERHSLSFSLPTGAYRAQIYVWKPAGTTSFTADDISLRAYIGYASS